MKPVWEIDGEDVEKLQGDSPGFVRFLNALLSFHAHEGHLPDSAVSLNQNDTEGDGGVDAVISQAILPSLDPTDRFSVPTCWQFKASPTENIKAKVLKGEKGGQEVALKQEINKPHARGLVEQGYGYRFCIADDMPDQKKVQWEDWLLAATREINPDAARPAVLTASDLALWANRFKPIVSEFFRPCLGPLRSLERWRSEIAGLTPKFVAIGGWDAAVRAIREHVDFSRRVTTILTVQGEAGVGKTRCTCEALLEGASHHALVLYTDDEKAAHEFAQVIARDNRLRAILVADECTLEFRDRLRQLLPGCADRLRVIAIDNSLQRAGGTGEVRLTQIDIPDVEAILSRNFSDLPPDRRLSYARLAQGFVRLAVDLCEHDALVPPDGRVDSVFGFFHDYYLERRLRPEELEGVLLISLLPRVGYRDDVVGQLESLCAHSRIDRRPLNIVEIAHRLRHSPGFLAVGGRFLYVTPMLIAQVAFQSAWERWVEPDPRRFMADFPPELIDPFIERVRSSGTSAMREFVTDFFLNWAANLDPLDLGRQPSVLRLVHLIEVQPETLVPILRGLLERTSLEELRRLHSGYEGEKARRQLVWLAEKLAYFAEFFAHAEAILLRLALAETEPHLGNNASRLWEASFRTVLSGTPVPFVDRLQLLEQRLRTADPQQLTLGLAALDEILADGPVSRLAAPPVLFGRLPPPQWKPSNVEQRSSCRGLALGMAARLAESGGPVADGLRSAVVNRLAPLLLAGHLEEVKTVLGAGPLPDALLATVVREIEKFFDVFCKDHPIPVHRTNNRAAAPGDEDQIAGSEMRHLPRVAGPDLEARVREWYRGLVPSGLHGRLVSLVGQDPWHHQLQGDGVAWQRELQKLALDLLRSPLELERELGWLCSSEARSAFHLGVAIGEADKDGALLDRMLSDFPLAGGTPLARGYLERVTTAHPQQLVRVNALLDLLQETHPRVAYDVLWSTGDEVQKVSRVLEMIDSGGLPAEFLRGLEYGIRERPLAIEELLQALKRLIHAARSGNRRAAQAAVHLLHGRLRPHPKASGSDVLRQEPRLRDVLPTVLELALDGAGREPNFWVALVEDLADVEIDQALGLAVRALESQDYNTRALAEECLVRQAGSHPDEVMRSLGTTILSPGSGWRFRIDDFSRLLAALPVEVVQHWLSETGVAGARGIARHLAPPYLDDEGRPAVPPLTSFVLDRFADDEQVFREFRAGTHSGRVYSGDIAKQHEGEATVARRFLGHPLRRIREWALSVIDSANRQAADWRQRDEEMVEL